MLCLFVEIDNTILLITMAVNISISRLNPAAGMIVEPWFSESCCPVPKSALFQANLSLKMPQTIFYNIRGKQNRFISVCNILYGKIY
jgi:hypothetical protein